MLRVIKPACFFLTVINFQIFLGKRKLKNFLNNKKMNANLTYLCFKCFLWQVNGIFVDENDQ